ncbi:hypothetical protein ACH4VR_14290 [Streptomyces sp. NPDC020883]|uniref:hypothetical protein n=1 Tax=Streptomyces sp. NPDC020883 TaxID=3365099 RepID=UPI0037B0D423
MTGIRPVTVVVTSSEFAERRDSCLPQIAVHLFSHPSRGYRCSGSLDHGGVLQPVRET